MTGEVVEIDYGGVAVVVDDDDLEVVPQGYGSQATLEKPGDVVVWNYY